MSGASYKTKYQTQTVQTLVAMAHEREMGIILAKLEHIEELIRQHVQDDKELAKRVMALERYANRAAGATLVMTAVASAMASYIIGKIFV